MAQVIGAGEDTGDLVNPEAAGGVRASATDILEADDTQTPPPGGAKPSGEKTPDGDEIVVLDPNEPAPKPSVKSKEKPEGEEEGETDLKDQIEEALEEEEDTDDIDQAEIEVLLGRPSPTAILKKYPEFFKEFPGVRQAIFREAKYSEVFPTIEDAEEARDKSSYLDSLEQTVLMGNPGPMLNEIARENPQAYEAFALNFLPALYSGDQKLYQKATYPILARLIRWVDQQGEAVGNVNIRNSAIVISKLLWPSQGGKIPGEPAGPPKLNPPPSQKTSYMGIPEGKAFVESIQTGIHRTLTKELERTFDPENALPEKIRKAAIEQIIEEVGDSLESDKQHMANMDALLRRAQRGGFSREDKPRILAAYLGRARQILPRIRGQYRKDATQQTGANPNQQQRPNLAGGGVKGVGNKRQVDPNDIDWTRTTPEMYLEDKVVLKKKTR